MTVKIQRWKDGNLYIVVHYRGDRKIKKCRDQAHAERVKKWLEVKLEELGPEAFRWFGKGERLPRFGSYSQKCLAQWRKTSRKETTVKRYANDLKNHLNPHLGKMTLDEITFRPLKELCLKLQETLAPTTIEGIMTVAHLVMKEAKREGLIASNPVEDLGEFYGTKDAVRPPDPFTRGEIGRILEASLFPWTYYLEFVTLSLYTGLRWGEAVALQWDDFDFRKRYVYVRRNWPANATKPTTPKTASSRRRVDLAHHLIPVMKKYKKRQKAIALREGRELGKWVFPSHKGRVPISHGWFTLRVWKRVQEKAEVRVRVWHNLRHTFATQLLMAGAKTKYVSRQLGHSSARITLDRYDHWIEEDAGVRGVDLLDQEVKDVEKEEEK